MNALPSPLFAGFSLVSLAVVGLGWFAWESRDNLPAGFSFAAVERAAPGAERAAAQLPFTFDDAVKYLQNSLAHPPQEKRSSYAVFRGGNAIEHFYDIALSSSGSDLVVKFQVIDDYGLNIVREFFEAPFIQAKESEQLYASLYMGSGIRTIKLSRFDVVFEYENRAERVAISLRFSPHGRDGGYAARSN